MFCKYCGKEIADSSVFCKYCGRNLSPQKGESDKTEPETTKTKIEAMPESAHKEKRQFYKWMILFSVIILSVGAAGFSMCSNNKQLAVRLDETETISKKEILKPTEASTLEPTATPEPSKEIKKPEETPAPTEVQEPDEENAGVPEPNYVEKKIRVKGASATSYLGTTAKDGQTYEPAHVIDGDITTAWIEGKDDLGIGESVTLDLGNNDRITRMLIYNGFMNTKYRYAVNGRVTRMLVEFNDGTSKTVAVNNMIVTEDKIPFGTDETNPTEVIFDEPISASSVKMTILDAIPGSKYTDVAISEVEVYHEIDEKEVAEANNTISEDVIDAYESYFEKNFPSNDYGGYSVALVYLDEDEIPELFVKANFDMGEVTALQYSDGNIYDLGCYIALDYIPYKNDIVNGWSDGETSEEIQMQLVNHRFVTVGGVSATYWDEYTTKYYLIDMNDVRTETSKDEYDSYFKKQRKFGNYTSSDEERYYLSVKEAYDNFQ